jgi:hypothetical protein
MSKIRIMGILLIVLAAFSAFAGGGSETQAGGSETQAAVSGQKIGDSTAPFIRIFDSGTYHIKASLSITGAKGTTTDIMDDVEVYSRGGTTAGVMSMAGISTRVVLKDKKTYSITDKPLKMVIISSSSQDAGGQLPKVETGKLTYTGSGTAVFAGKSLPYDEYQDTAGVKSQYFVNGNKLAGIRTITGKGNEDMVISVLDQNVPNNVFDIPNSGYLVRDMSGGSR